jgi:hypothetical protein
MRIVSESSEAELAARRAMLLVEDALTQLAANILRVARGAGQPTAIMTQAASLLTAMEAYREAAGYYPTDRLAGVLRGWGETPAGVVDDEYLLALAEQQAVRGALQLVASALLSQRVQERAGRDELHDGMFETERIREARRRAFAAAQRSARSYVQPKPKKSRGIRVIRRELAEEFGREPTDEELSMAARAEELSGKTRAQRKAASRPRPGRSIGQSGRAPDPSPDD